MRKILKPITNVLFIFILLIVILLSVFSFNSNMLGVVEEQNIPTVFLHGSPTVKNVLMPMMERISKDASCDFDLNLDVDNRGHVISSGSYSRSDKNPLIQITFENNDSTEHNQVAWLANCLEYLKSHYGIEEVNFVGHSMGGVDVLLYLTNYEPMIRYKVPRINKVVTLGSPFNGESSYKNKNYKRILKHGPKETTETFDIIRDGMLTHDLQVTSLLNIAGEEKEGSNSDGTVPIGSVASISPLLKQDILNYQFKVVKDVDHSGLHDSEQVDKLIEKFLWN